MCGAVLLLALVTIVVLLLSASHHRCPPCVVVKRFDDGGGVPVFTADTTGSTSTAAGSPPDVSGLVATPSGTWTLGLLSTAFLKQPVGALGGQNVAKFSEQAYLKHATDTLLPYCDPNTNPNLASNAGPVPASLAGVFGTWMFAGGNLARYLLAESTTVTKTLSWLTRRVAVGTVRLARKAGATKSLVRVPTRRREAAPLRKGKLRMRRVRKPVPAAQPRARQGAFRLGCARPSPPSVNKVIHFTHAATGSTLVPDFAGTAASDVVTRWTPFTPALQADGVITAAGGIVVRITEKFVKQGASAVASSKQLTTGRLYELVCPGVNRTLTVLPADEAGGTFDVDLLLNTLQWSAAGSAASSASGDLFRFEAWSSAMRPPWNAQAVADNNMRTIQPLAACNELPPLPTQQGGPCPLSVAGPLAMIAATGAAAGMYLQTDGVVPATPQLGTCKLAFGPEGLVRTNFSVTSALFTQPSTLMVTLSDAPSSPCAGAPPANSALTLPPSTILRPLNAVASASSEVLFATADAAQPVRNINLYLNNKQKLTTLTWSDLRTLKHSWFTIADADTGYLLVGYSTLLNTASISVSDRSQVVWRQSGDVGTVMADTNQQRTTVYVPPAGDGFSEADGSLMYPWARWIIHGIVPLAGHPGAVGLWLSCGNLGNTQGVDPDTSRVHTLQSVHRPPSWITTGTVDSTDINGAFWSSAAATSAPMLMVLQGATQALPFLSSTPPAP